MIISTDISETRGDAIDALKLDPVRDAKTVRVLYYLAGEADRLEAHGDLPYEADIAADIFDDAVTAVRRGELAA